MLTLCIAVHDDMLAAALAVSAVERPLSLQETLQAREKRYQVREAPYPAWYLFGCRDKQTEGLVKQYSMQGASVYLCPESLLSGQAEADIFDTQFSTMPDSLCQHLTKKHKMIFGYLPESFSSKSYQAAALQDNGGKLYLPMQQTYRKNSRPDLPEIGGKPVWIVKTPYGSAGNNSSGTPYTVWKYTKLQEQLPSLLSALNDGEELICSEFITTCDPYAGHADHVVHKMPFIGLTDSAARPYGNCCQKFIYHCNWASLEEKQTLPLGEFIGTPKITTGRVDSICGFSDFVDALSFHQGRIMLSVDFIVPTDGVPRFLESNKLAATFAESFDPLLPPLIDYYAGRRITANIHIPFQNTKNKDTKYLL